MSRRVETVSRITQVINHQKEVIELQVIQIQKRLSLEENRLAHLENQLQGTLITFEEKVKDRWVLDSQEMDYLYGISSHLFTKIEKKNKEVSKIQEELTAQKAILLEAYKKKKSFEILKNKMVFQERRDAELWEQKSMDYLTIVKRSRR